MKPALPLLSALLLMPLPALNAAAAPKQKPNILFVITDDIGWGDFRCYNPDGKIPTPAADKLAATGMRFTDAHTSAAVCAPSRYSLLTGNYPWRGRKPEGVWNFTGGSDILPGQKTVGAILHEAGYRTALCGKTGIGADCPTKAGKNPKKPELDWTQPLPEGPVQWGFDYSYVLLQGHQGAPYMFFENGRVDGDVSKIVEVPRVKAEASKEDLGYKIMNRGGPSLPDWDCRQVGETLLRKTETFLDAHAASNKAEGSDRPFYIHLSTAGAHSPYFPPDTIRGTAVKGVSGMTAHTDTVVEADVVLGKLVELLESRGLLTDTLIVLTSDNGGLAHEREFNHDAVNGLRGGKGSVFEGGHRVPLIVRWGDGTASGSKIAPGSVSHQMVAVHDLVASFAELAGAKTDPDQMRDSISLVSVLRGKRGDDRSMRQTLISQSSHGAPAKIGPGASPLRKADAIPDDDMAHSLRDGNWKLVFNTQSEAVALFDLASSLSEKNNLINAPEQATRVEQMVKLYTEIRQSKRSASATTND
jgi:arylsulfatase A-like enzyme